VAAGDRDRRQAAGGSPRPACPSCSLRPDGGGRGPGRQRDRLARRGLGWSSYGMIWICPGTRRV